MNDSSTSVRGSDLERRRLVDDLRRPEAYGHAVEDVGFLQTHISLLFFAGERVYKVKKPVALGFLDFTRLERRKHFCEEEVRLNRRLAPEVYLGVVPITRASDGHLRIGGDGPAVEWAVEMVRLPERRMLSSLLERGELDNEVLNALVALLSAFHAAAPTGAGVDEHGSPESVRHDVEENGEQLLPFVAEAGTAPRSGLRVLSARQHEFLRARRRAFFRSQGEFLARRVREGRIREGHGDLHAGNVCITEAGPVAYDCIEFNRRFRCGDVAADLAFLAMDLDYRGYPGFSKYMVKRYARETDDPELPELLEFYKGYRAIVRGKVLAMTAADPGVPDAQREESRRASMRHVQLACAYELPPAMVLMCGLPACGKSWMARRLAGALRGAVLQSDVRRKVLSQIAVTKRVAEGYDAGLYSPEMKRKTYRSLLSSALDNLRAGHSVLVDATFSKRAYRAEFVDAAARLGLPYFLVHVAAPEEVIRERLERRAADSREASDADLAVYLRERDAFEPPEELPAAHVLDVVSGVGVAEEQSSIVIDRMIALREGD